MMERPLMTPDELKSLPKGQFIVMKTGAYPMKVKLKLFFKWGIEFDEKNPYVVPENANRVVHYADKQRLIASIRAKYPWVQPTEGPQPQPKPKHKGKPFSQAQQRTPQPREGRQRSGGVVIDPPTGGAQ